MRPATYEELLEILRRLDIAESPRGARAGDDNQDLIDELSRYFVGREATRSVLGVDIYQYSRYSGETQRLVPVVFEYLYRLTCDETCKREPLFLDRSDIEGRFISAGDGGFQILDSPLQALVFAIYLQANVHAFNAGFILPKLRRLVGVVTLRYAVTRDTLFQLDNNWFGSGIISNARILSRDRLNRCLTDECTVAWFAERLGSIESLLLFNTAALLARDLVPHPEAEPKSLLFSADLLSMKINAFQALNVQKIGVVTAKANELDIYNLHVQLGLTYTAAHDNSSAHHPTVITLGNLNTSGITA